MNNLLFLKKPFLFVIVYCYRKTKVEDETEREGAGSQMSHKSKTSRIGSRLGSRVGSRLSHHSNAPPKVSIYWYIPKNLNQD